MNGMNSWEDFQWEDALGPIDGGIGTRALVSANRPHSS